MCTGGRAGQGRRGICAARRPATDKTEQHSSVAPVPRPPAAPATAPVARHPPPMSAKRKDSQPLKATTGKVSHQQQLGGKKVKTSCFQLCCTARIVARQTRGEKARQ